jgi:hypothetical protein
MMMLKMGMVVMIAARGLIVQDELRADWSRWFHI